MIPDPNTLHLPSHAQLRSILLCYKKLKRSWPIKNELPQHTFGDTISAAFPEKTLRFWENTAKIHLHSYTAAALFFKVYMVNYRNTGSAPVFPDGFHGIPLQEDRFLSYAFSGSSRSLILERTISKATSFIPLLIMISAIPLVGSTYK